MLPKTLEDIANYLVAEGKGILAADESSKTIEKRFKAIHVASTKENRRKYREMLFRSSNLPKAISGVILFDETLRQQAANGTLLRDILHAQGALTGIKVDLGPKPFNEQKAENLTTGLEGLRERCREYKALGASFTKWRAVLNISDIYPSDSCIYENMKALADYAAIVQENEMVPIVEPEVIMDGNHTIDRCYDVTKKTLSVLFEQLKQKDVNIKGTLLKPNMVISGTKHPHQASVEEVAEKTLRCLTATVPDTLPGIVFLSGGQSDIDATAHLNEMNKRGTHKWKLSFSYGRALQQAALNTWSGKDNQLDEAQKAFNHRVLMNHKATLGIWDASLEK